jgi:hypothetical protein
MSYVGDQFNRNLQNSFQQQQAQPQQPQMPQRPAAGGMAQAQPGPPPQYGGQPSNGQGAYNMGMQQPQPQGQPAPYGGSGNGFGPQQPMHPVDAFHQMIDHPHGQQILQQRGWTPPPQGQRAVGMVQPPQGQPQPVAGNGQIQPPTTPTMPNPGLPRRV